VAARRAVLAIDAEGEARRRRNARCTRDAWVSDQDDGISLFMAAMATEDAHAVLTALNTHANALADCPGSDGDPVMTIGERRVRALAQLVLGGDSAGIAPRRAHLDLVIDLPTFLALRDQSAAGSVELRGAGPLSSDVVRDLLAYPDVAISIRRLVTDPLTGHLLDYGRRTYAIPQRLREFIIAGDRTCRFPGCGRRADLSQIDHALAWDDGGQTSPGISECSAYDTTNSRRSRAGRSPTANPTDPVYGSHRRAADTTITRHPGEGSVEQLTRSRGMHQQRHHDAIDDVLDLGGVGSSAGHDQLMDDERSGQLHDVRVDDLRRNLAAHDRPLQARHGLDVLLHAEAGLELLRQRRVVGSLADEFPQDNSQVRIEFRRQRRQGCQQVFAQRASVLVARR
jgi:hypothetical protein